MIPPDVPPEAIATGPPSAPTSAVAPPSPPPAPTALPSTPLNWRLAIGIAIGVVGGAAYLLQPVMGPRGQALAGVFCFFGLVAAFSTNLRAVNWRTIAWGVGLQLVLAVLVLKVGYPRATTSKEMASLQAQHAASLIGISTAGPLSVFPVA